MSRISIRIPNAGVTLAVGLVVIGAMLAVRAWLVHSSQRQVMDAFLEHARAGNFSACRAMLADGAVLPTEQELEVAAQDSFLPEPSSFSDFLIGRQHFSNRGYPRNVSFTVSHGRVMPGSGFLQYFPAGPEFKLTKEVAAPERGR